MQSPNRDRPAHEAFQGAKQMFGKADLVQILGRDLARARTKRDALTSDITTLTAQIADLE
jgi:hypothetical protein